MKSILKITATTLILLIICSVFSASAATVEQLKQQLNSYYMILVNRDHLVNDKYQPTDLVTYPGSSYRLNRTCAAALKEMIDACAANTSERLVLYSGYRTYQTQYNKYYGKINQYISRGYSKSEAIRLTNQYYAPPGGSEHHTGLAADICTPSIVNRYGQLDSSFANTAEGKWLRNNCHKYGFILRYDKGKENITGYNYEPWHFRYIGKEHAKEVARLGITYEEYITRMKTTVSALATAPTFTYKNNKVYFSAKNATIRYTTDTKTPTASSKVYTDGLGGKDITYKAITCLNGYTSPVATVTVTKYGDVFKDININDWYYENVSTAVHKQLFNGMGNYEFAPNGTMTRAMAVQVLANISGIDLTSYTSKTKFADVKPTAWYARAVAWATENNIVAGIGQNKFAPDNAVTREQICVMLYNQSGATAEESIPFTDAADVSPWAKAAVAYCAKEKIINGYPNGSFKPRASITRAEMATITLSYIE